MTPYTIPTKFTAIDGISPVVKGMERNVYSFAEKANAGIARQERLFRKLTPNLGHATKQLLSYASAGAVLGGLGYSGKAIMDYETSIQSLSAVTGVGGAQLDEFKKQINDLANQSKKSATEVAGSFETIGSMMSEYLTDPKGLRQISEAGITLAKASRQELVPTLENLTSIMNQFDLKASQAADTINRLTAGEIVGSLRTSQVAEALQEFGAGAYSANVSLAESVALVEALGKQMKMDKIGVGARNILTVLDSAKGLDKKARRDLRRSGVDLGFLMDRTQTLSARLHELSKISGNATVITSVFGKENKTAAQVIFNQLGTYDQYLAKIKTTNEANHQAAVNSATLSQSIDRLKNTWINYITTSDQAASGTAKLTSAFGYITEHLDTIVSVGVGALKFMVLWKGAILAAKIATTSYSVALGIQAGVTGFATYALEANTIAMKVATATEKIWSVATAVATGNFAALNAVLLANPIGVVVAGLVALGGALYLANKRSQELTEQYKKQIDVNMAAEMQKETDSVKKLVWQYWELGQTTKQATLNAIKFKNVNIDFRRQQVEKRIERTKAELEQEKGKLYLADLFAGGGTPEIGRRKELAMQLEQEQKTAAMLASDKAAIASFAQEQVGKGNISAKDAFPGKAKTTPEIQGPFSNAFKAKSEKENFRFYQKSEPFKFDYERFGIEVAKAIKNQEVNVNINTGGSGPTTSTSGVSVSTPKSY